jgi:D-alanyl-lipoteichoic acid acyltransferase DltB (MBOAT superfamily)
MSFTDIVFVPFLLVVFCSFALARNRPLLQLLILLIASFSFYSWWRLDCVAILLFPALVDYALANLIHRTEIPWKRKLYLLLSLVSNLGLLGYFKYFNWMVDDVNWLLARWQVRPFANPSIILPVGISFYTFMTLSYTIDIYRREIQPCPSLLRYLVFVAFFPHLVAGPILRAKELLPQLEGDLARRSDPSGLWLILYGFAKKLFLADVLAAVVVNPTLSHLNEHSAPELLLAIYGFAFQIFLDFSSYSDIAIGLGRLFGVRLPLNFDCPYVATNPQEFWRRWHITLSTWFRDYLYIPLGGNRGGRWLTARNLAITMLLAGAWHGARGTFVLWGALHGLYLGVYREFDRQVKKGRLGWWLSVPRAVRCCFFFQFVCLAWVFFRLESLEQCGQYFHALAHQGWRSSHVSSTWLVLFAAAGLVHFGIEPVLYRMVALLSRLRPVVCALAYQLLFLVFYATDVAKVGHQVFIYFQF